MGWTSHAIFPSSPPRRRVAGPTSHPLDEFSDLPPEFSDDHIRVEMPALAPRSESVDQVAAPGPVAETAPTLARPDNYRFWEQTSVRTAAGEAATGEDPRPYPVPETKVEPAAAAATSAASEAVAPSPVAAPPQRLNDLRPSTPAPSGEAGAQAADMAWSLLEIISLSNDTAQPQERALAADALLNLLPKLTARILMTIADRMSLDGCAAPADRQSARPRPAP